MLKTMFSITLTATLLVLSGCNRESSQPSQKIWPPSSSQFVIPDGSAYVCRSRSSGLLLQLRYSRTSPELAAIAQHESGRIENISRWRFHIPDGRGHDGGLTEENYHYQNQIVDTSFLSVYPSSKRVVMGGLGESIEFSDCLMVGPS